jgi:hypothetical protein
MPVVKKRPPERKPRPKAPPTVAQVQSNLPQTEPVESENEEVEHPAFVVRQARLSPQSLNQNQVLLLQQTIGNQAVQRLLGARRVVVQPAVANDRPVQRLIMSNAEWQIFSFVARPSGEAYERSARLKEIDVALQGWDAVKSKGNSKDELKPKLKAIVTLQKKIWKWQSAKKKGGALLSKRNTEVSFLLKQVQDTNQELMLKVEALPLKAKTEVLDSVLPQSGASTALEARIKSSANPARAKQALQELKAIQGTNDASKARLTNGIVELLVWGVANRRTARSIGNEGVLGIEQAVNAAQALVAMKLVDYLDIVSKLALTGGDEASWSQQKVESALILKAVAARKQKYLADDASSKKEVDQFAEEIRGQDRNKLKKLTSTRDIGGGQGLQQKFTMSCGPTSIQIIHGESDPIYALEVSKIAKHDLDYKNKVAQEQQNLLGQAAPRKIKDLWDQFKADLNGKIMGGKDVDKWQAVLNFIGGKPYDAVKYNAGLKLAQGLNPKYTASVINDFKTYNYGLENEPGLSVSEFQKAMTTAKLNVPTNIAHPLHQFNKKTKPIQDTDLDDVWKKLFRGVDVPVGVFWAGGGGHYMVLTDCKGKPPKGGASRQFLLSDPWEGKSEWLSNDDLKNGKFGSFGKGYIDDIYY